MTWYTIFLNNERSLLDATNPLQNLDSQQAWNTEPLYRYIRLLRFENILTIAGRPLKYVEDVALKFEENEAPLRRQVNALARLREDMTWRSVFLNNEPSLLKKTNPFDDLDYQRVQEAFKTALSLKA
ncbi:hypothetical protein Plec18170_003216 [Paecilomyces lecythidis]